MLLKYFAFSFSLFVSFVQATEIWLFEQEFVRFGKKDVYESLKKEWNTAFVRDFKEKNGISPVLAIQDFDSPLYIYLTPMLDYAALEVRTSQLDSFTSKLKDSLTAAFASTLNFRVTSLQTYLPECSHRPEGGNCSFFRLPYIQYQIFSLTPGSELLFEEHLKKLVFEERVKKSTVCWRVWKVIYGGDVPKYAVCRFAETKKALESEEIKFIHEDLKEIVRRHRESRGIFRRDLTIMSNNVE